MRQPAPDAEILNSWKEISRYLNYDVRTLQRWELTRGLPMRRMPGGTKPGVYAVKSELDSWRRSRSLHTAVREDDSAATPLSIAVLPFLNLARDEDQYFADGLADEIITALSILPGFRVTARTSSFAFRGKEQDIREIGRKLNAHAVLEGSIRRSGDRLRVTAQLIDASEGYHLWSERFDRELTDVFAIQDDITRAVVEALRLRLTHAVPLARRRTENLDAYHLWLKGRYHTLRQTPNEILRSRELFGQAIALDPDFARAHIGLAESYWEGAVLGLDRPRDAVAIGRRSLLKALDIDYSLGEAHAMLGVYLGVHDFDWEAGERAFRRGLELSPASPQVRIRYATWLLEPNLRLDEARAELESALGFDPLSPIIHACLGHELIFRRNFREASKELELAIELDACYWMAHLMLAGSYAFQGRFDESLAVCEKSLEATGQNQLFMGATALVLAILGDRQRAEEIRRRITDMNSYVSKVALAWISMGLGEPELCLNWLEKAVEEREPLIVELNPKPLYDTFRPHPRFRRLLSEMGLVKPVP
ncbi:MAG: tetratricopeptide repeat protein [Acidobacteria bacterium]|nr:tetratricopeptide repeat protein [Acidobacteriota bacterium]